MKAVVSSVIGRVLTLVRDRGCRKSSLLAYGRSNHLGYDQECGRHLYHDVSINGIDGLQAEGLVTMQIGGTPSARFWKITLEQVQDQLLEAGLLTSAELEDYRSLLDGPKFRWFTSMVVSVWGRRIATP
jgi:hypothetical protein